MKIERITKNDHQFDELVVRDVALVHIERMDDTHIWMSIGDNDSRTILRLQADGTIQVTVEEEL